MASFAPEILFSIGAFPVTNTIISTIFVDSLLIGSAFYISKHMRRVPGVFQNIVEFAIDTFYNLTETIAGENTKKIFPWFMSFFFFILIANWSGLIPGISTVGVYQTVEGKKELVPFIRNLTSDANATFALAILSVIVTHVLAVKKLGAKAYLSRYFSLNPVMLYVGILEIISEFTKIVSLSFRLFGNIYAGEVVLTKVSSLFAFLAPVPFLLLEVIVGLVQALVFAMLTMVFMSILMTPHHSEEH